MKKALILIIFLVGISDLAFSQTEKRIEDIRKTYTETNKKVEECEKNGQYSDNFLIESITNKNGGSYPAIGTYKSVIKFYYTFGNREENPYPDRLLKIMIKTNRAALVENSEFLFNPKGELIFYFEKKEGIEKRIYFENEKPIKILEGEKTLSAEDKEVKLLVDIVLGGKKNLESAFYSLLNN